MVRIFNSQWNRQSEKIAVAAEKLTQWSTFLALTIEMFSHLNLFPLWGKVSRWQILIEQPTQNTISNRFWPDVLSG
jgi:ABC-type uncharacterized transport system YnjBCD permease subunit